MYDDVFAVRAEYNPEPRSVAVGASSAKCRGVRIAGVVDIRAAGAGSGSGSGSSGKSAAYHSIRIGQAQQARSSSTYFSNSFEQSSLDTEIVLR